MRTKLALSILLILLGVVSWWMFVGNSARRESAAPGRVPTSGRATDSSGIDPTADSAGITSLTDADVAQLIDMDPGGRVEALLKLEDAIEVEVTDAVTGDPVPQAEIRWVAVGRKPGPAILGQLTDSCQVEELIASRGRRTTTDASGHARLPPFDGHGAITASSAGRWGQQRVGLVVKHVQRIVLHPDGELRVQVVDSNGSPMMGRRVELLQQSESAIKVAASARTDAVEGLATIRHAGWAMSREPDSQWHVALEAPLAELARVPVSPDSLGDTPVRLIYPDSGEVEVCVLEPDGRPARGRSFVRLVHDDDFMPLEAYAVEGRAFFPEVDLGLELTCSARRGFLDHMLATVSVRGPARPGERVRAEIHLGLAHPIVIGRLLLDADEPLRLQRINARLFQETADGVRLSNASTSTEQDGRFQFDLSKFDSDSGHQILTLAWNGDAAHPQREATRILRDVPSSGYSDLGDLHLSAPPLLASGQVLDRHRQPVGRFKISVLDGEMMSTSEIRWFPRPDLATESQADGSFEVRGYLGMDRLRVFLVGAKERVFEVPVGTQGVILQYIPCGTIAGSLVRSNRVPNLTIECRPSALIEAHHGIEHAPSVRRHGTYFYLDGVPPGIWTVSLAVDADSAPFLEVHDIVVESNEVSRDRRLKRISVPTLYGR